MHIFPCDFFQFQSYGLLLAPKFKIWHVPRTSLSQPTERALSPTAFCATLLLLIAKLLDWSSVIPLVQVVGSRRLPKATCTQPTLLEDTVVDSSLPIKHWKCETADLWNYIGLCFTVNQPLKRETMSSFATTLKLNSAKYPRLTGIQFAYGTSGIRTK